MKHYSVIYFKPISVLMILSLVITLLVEQGVRAVNYKPGFTVVNETGDSRLPKNKPLNAHHAICKSKPFVFESAPFETVVAPVLFPEPFEDYACSQITSNVTGKILLILRDRGCSIETQARM